MKEEEGKGGSTTAAVPENGGSLKSTGCPPLAASTITILASSQSQRKSLLGFLQRHRTTDRCPCDTAWKGGSRQQYSSRTHVDERGERRREKRGEGGVTVPPRERGGERGTVEEGRHRRRRGPRRPYRLPPSKAKAVEAATSGTQKGGIQDALRPPPPSLNDEQRDRQARRQRDGGRYRERKRERETEKGSLIFSFHHPS